MIAFAAVASAGVVPYPWGAAPWLGAPWLGAPWVGSPYAGPITQYSTVPAYYPYPAGISYAHQVSGKQ